MYIMDRSFLTHFPNMKVLDWPWILQGVFLLTKIESLRGAHQNTQAIEIAQQLRPWEDTVFCRIPCSELRLLHSDSRFVWGVPTSFQDTFEHPSFSKSGRDLPVKVLELHLS